MTQATCASCGAELPEPGARCVSCAQTNLGGSKDVTVPLTANDTMIAGVCPRFFIRNDPFLPDGPVSNETIRPLNSTPDGIVRLERLF